MRKQIFSTKYGGFTLIESLVAITVFLVVVTMVSSIYISFIRQERRLYAFLRTENNIRFALDYIGRDIRMAKEYSFTENISSDGSSTLSFKDYKGQDTVYSLRENNIYADRAGNSVPLLDETIEIKFLRFYITEGEKGESQPTVIIAFEATDKNTDFNYSLQTAVTPRNLNFETLP